MTRTKARMRPLVVLLALLVTSACAVAGPLEKSARAKFTGKNIALHKPYQWNTEPNYSYSTDADDIRQLTDGQYSRTGRFWVQKTTVGWQTWVRPVVVTIDLGQVYSIGGVSYSTAAGDSDVDWPFSMYILVSDDGARFYEAGELVSLSAEHNPLPHPGSGHIRHRFLTGDLKTHGRYVKFVITGSILVFVDEIEVYEGDPSWRHRRFVGKPIVQIDPFWRTRELNECIRRRLRDDLQAVRRATEVSKTVSDEISRQITAELDQIEREVPKLNYTARGRFRAIFPLNRLHERIFRAQARLWRASGIAPLTIWQTPIWDPLSHTQPPPRQEPVEINVAMMQNEYRAAAFNITNASDTAKSLRLRIGLASDGVDPSYITVHEVAWTDTKHGDLAAVAAALPVARRDRDGYVITVPSGLTRQVWLTFHSKDLQPGLREGRILLAEGTAGWQIPIVVKIYPLRFPDRPTLHLGGWDYTDAESSYRVNRRTRPMMINHLKEHFVDSPWASSPTLARGRYDKRGKMIVEPNTSRFDKWVNRWRDARRYCVYINAKDQFDGSRMNTPIFAKKVRSWISFWAEHMKKRGLKPQQLVILIVDEPKSPSQDRIILAWIKPILAARTGVIIWEDPAHKDPYQADQKMMRSCNVLCVHRPKFLRAKQSYRDYYRERQKEGIDLAFYGALGPARRLDPYTYYRLQAWTCWQYGAVGSGFWAFGDAGRSSPWNEYLARRRPYTPLFPDAKSITTGKHMEAIREGIEDYEYLIMLRQQIREAKTRRIDQKQIDYARKLLAEAANRVCRAPGASAFKWIERKDRTVADRVRIEILEAIVDLAENRKESR